MNEWSPIANVYNPLKAGSIDGTDLEPHDRAVWRAMFARYKPNKGVVGDPLLTLYVARLNPQTTEERLREVFSKYGQINGLRLVRDIVTGFSKRYAFIEYKEERSIVRARREANKLVVDQNELFVDFEQERTLKGWTPRRLGGGQGGKKESGQLRFGGKDRPFRKPISLGIGHVQDWTGGPRDWERGSREREDRHGEREREDRHGERERGQSTRHHGREAGCGGRGEREAGCGGRGEREAGCGGRGEREAGCGGRGERDERDRGREKDSYREKYKSSDGEKEDRRPSDKHRHRDRR
ncbi:hypothetical protein NHX12_009533 [Muraenolepis orangiensis]|uniref:U11/U12 small nuclear ribonucleoprotein 35 kDa protein n=1 Tax=Muraenolepis orangiensis TaxID=630683 RepID=A0A9Q0DGL8_9TELE|nr:hypothetical protein NHX12_009533 [Muraenolepis orangiensis]